MRKLKLLLVLVLTSSFLYAQDYDSPAGALVIPHQNGWTSGPGVYSIVGATVVEPSSTCGAIFRNRWFKFTAGLQYIDITITPIGGNVQSSLWYYDGSIWNEVVCFPGNNGNPVSISSNALVIGEEYYLSVGGPFIDFGLSVSTIYTYDYPEGAITIPHQNGWTSGPGAYSIVGATVVEPTSSCGTIYRNRWFKFIATGPYAEITVTPAGGMYAKLALWKNDGTNWLQMACQTGNNTDPVSISSTTLVAGLEYYLSVGGAYSSFALSMRGGSSSPWILEEGVIHPVELTSKVAIGRTDVPSDYSLAIDGKAIMEEVKVQLSENWLWPDYVFEEDYDLRTLQEIKAYISENKHLPDVPAAREVQAAGGIEIGAMNVLLLRKIEELTLHLIEQEQKLQELDNLKQEIKYLRQEVQKLKE